MQVKPNDSQPAEESPSQTASAASPGAAAEEKSPSGITKVPPHTQSEDIVLNKLLNDDDEESDKLKNCDAAEDLLSQTVSILSPEVSTEDKTSSCSTEVLHNIEEKDSVLQQASQSALDSSHVCSSIAVEIPFLSDNVNDDQSERREEIEMTETPAKQNDTEDSQVCTRLTETSAKQNDTEDSQVCEVCVAPALDSSSLLSALSDIPCVPVLVREKDMGLTETSAKQNDTEDSQVCVAPALDSSSLSNTLSDIPCISVLVREKDNELTETSAKQNDTDDSEVCVAPALHSSSLPSVLSDIPCVSVLVREKDNGLIETSAKQNDTEDCQVYVIPALHSSSLPSTFSDIRCVPVLVREKDTRWNPSHVFKRFITAPIPSILVQIRPQETYMVKVQDPTAGKIVTQDLLARETYPLKDRTEVQNYPVEISNVYGMPCHFSPERSVAPSTKKKETTSSCHLNAEEETNSSAPSWTPKDHSAAVLARKEELEQAYLQVLLNFGVIAIMLVEKEPCMIEAMSSALRANLRKIGDYYECLLKNYIDSLS
ncbi:sraP: SraP [Crotalus adamanteus]|uniref:SraP: SraP n=1 Tax=Crotalus adamanteus TaxID=8729 RepID=A0AAW1BRM0_CROAD